MIIFQCSISQKQLAAIAIFAVLVMLTSPSKAVAWWPFGNNAMDYNVVLDGADEEMQAWLAQLKLDQPTETNPPETMEELLQEANGAAERVKKALQAKGYMEAHTEGRVDSSVRPPVLWVHIDQNTPYPVTSILFEWPGDPLRKIDLTELQSKKGNRVDMEAIKADADYLVGVIGRENCLISLSVTPRLRLYAESRSAELVFDIAHGARAHFGQHRISGNPAVNDEVIERSLTWDQGDCYDASKVQKTQTSLIQSQLFSTVKIEPVEPPDGKGEVLMDIEVKERVARTVSAGAKYATDEGVGIYGGWEHRNYLGGAEKLTTGLTLADMRQEVAGVLRIPAFMQDNQILALSSSIRRENTDAYESLTFDGGASVERRFSPQLNGSVGVAYTLSTTEDVLAGDREYALLSFPSFVEYDTRDDMMNATSGVLGRLSVTPYTETIGDGGQFVKMQAIGQAYLTGHDLFWKPTLAGRISVGSIAGGENDDIPANLRFYAGGGGSVRGFEYQSLAPYFSGSPIGGSSLVEISAELRLRFNEEFGAVAFVDAGNAYTESSPDFSGDIYYGAGVGIRYYSAIGPLRADIALPMNGKDIGQDEYQFYISLGQAF
jgi:translocation and assembly module TamA